MPKRSYEQYCPVAVALDVLGDRWTLLLVRELLLAPRRYTDLQRALPGASPNLLAQRLRELEAAGLVAREQLPPPAARTVYVLTDEGREAREVVTALARFGVRYLDEPAPDTEVRPAMAVHAALRPFFDAGAATAVDGRYRLVLAGRSFDLEVAGGRLIDPVPGSAPDLVIEMDPALLVEARKGRADLAALARAGAVRLEGDEAAFDSFLRCFALADPVPSSR